MRISDWSSDVCSSDRQRLGLGFGARAHVVGFLRGVGQLGLIFRLQGFGVEPKLLGFIQLLRDLRDLLVEHRADRGRCLLPDQHCEKDRHRSEEHTSELQSLMRISYAVFCLKKKKKKNTR